MGRFAGELPPPSTKGWKPSPWGPLGEVDWGSTWNDAIRAFLQGPLPLLIADALVALSFVAVVVIGLTQAVQSDVPMLGPLLWSTLIAPFQVGLRFMALRRIRGEEVRLTQLFVAFPRRVWASLVAGTLSGLVLWTPPVLLLGWLGFGRSLGSWLGVAAIPLGELPSGLALTGAGVAIFAWVWAWFPRWLFAMTVLADDPDIRGTDALWLSMRLTALAPRVVWSLSMGMFLIWVIFAVPTLGAIHLVMGPIYNLGIATMYNRLAFQAGLHPGQRKRPGVSEMGD